MTLKSLLFRSNYLIKKIRIINAYGPQECSQAQRPTEDQQTLIINFWNAMEREIIDAQDEGCWILIELDANAKVGDTVLDGDPNRQSPNGKLLLDMMERQNLNILNSSKKCQSKITRERKTCDRVEKSIIDFIIVSVELEDFLDKMIIDDER